MAFSNIGAPPQQAFASQSALNTVGAYLDNGIARAYHSLFVVSGASVSAGAVVIELSNDGVNWYAPASNSVTTNAASSVFSITVGPLPYQFARARIGTGITGGTVTATVASA